MPSLAEINAELDTERRSFKTWYDGFDLVDGKPKMSSDDVKQFQTRNARLEELSTQASAIKGAADRYAELSLPERRIVGGEHIDMGLPGDGRSMKSLGELFVESAAFKERPSRSERRAGAAHEIDVDKTFGKGRGFKTLFDTSTGFALQNIRLPEPITPGAQLPTIASLMPEGRTAGNAILYMEETTTTSNAAEVAEGATKPEAALAFTEKTSNVRKVAVSLPVTDESLEDVPFIESYIDTRLAFFIRQREDSQLLNGNGTAPNLRGLLNVSGILTQARGTDPNQDAIFKAATAIQVNSFFDATAVVLYPTNWQTIRLMTSADGIYLFGPPSQGGPKQLWGYDVVTTTAIAAGTGLVGAFNVGAEVFRRTELAMSVGYVNDQFVKNQRTILVEERLALVAFRPTCFNKVTGLS